MFKLLLIPALLLLAGCSNRDTTNVITSVFGGRSGSTTREELVEEIISDAEFGTDYFAPRCLGHTKGYVEHLLGSPDSDSSLGGGRSRMSYRVYLKGKKANARLEFKYNVCDKVICSGFQNEYKSKKAAQKAPKVVYAAPVPVYTPAPAPAPVININNNNNQSGTPPVVVAHNNAFAGNNSSNNIAR